MKLPSFIILIATLSLASTVAQEAQSLVPINFPTNSTFLPRNWTKAPIHAEIQPLDKAMQEQAKRIIDFYRTLDPEMDRLYFRKLTTGQPAIMKK